MNLLPASTFEQLGRASWQECLERVKPCFFSFFPAAQLDIMTPAARSTPPGAAPPHNGTQNAKIRDPRARYRLLRIL